MLVDTIHIAPGFEPWQLNQVKVDRSNTGYHRKIRTPGVMSHIRRGHECLEQNRREDRTMEPLSADSSTSGILSKFHGVFD
jgi:hypothetical protein